MLPPNVEEFGTSTFFGCTSITAIDMSSLTGVRKLPDYFMYCCSDLTDIKLPPNLEEFGSSTLCGCISLKAIDMSSLTGVGKLPTAT